MNAQFSIIRDKKAETDHWTTLERGLRMMIASNFKNYNDFYVISDLKRYKPSMDASVFDEKIGKRPEICEIYCKGEFVCSVSLMDSPATALTKINDGMIDMIKRKG